MHTYLSNMRAVHPVFAYPSPHLVWGYFSPQVIRSYHGHLSGVYCIALHPSLDILMTGGRDSVVRVWDMRTKVQAMVLSGHDQTVCSLLAQAADPQVRWRCGMGWRLLGRYPGFGAGR
jgi:WD40 repeat protein